MPVDDNQYTNYNWHPILAAACMKRTRQVESHHPWKPQLSSREVWLIDLSSYLESHAQCSKYSLPQHTVYACVPDTWLEERCLISCINNLVRLRSLGGFSLILGR
jgi:hypothetical protein